MPASFPQYIHNLLPSLCPQLHPLAPFSHKLNPSTLFCPSKLLLTTPNLNHLSSPLAVVPPIIQPSFLTSLNPPPTANPSLELVSLPLLLTIALAFGLPEPEPAPMLVGDGLRGEVERALVCCDRWWVRAAVVDMGRAEE